MNIFTTGLTIIFGMMVYLSIGTIAKRHNNDNEQIKLYCLENYNKHNFSSSLQCYDYLKGVKYKNIEIYLNN